MSRKQLSTFYTTSNSYLVCVINIEKLLYDSHKDPSSAVRKMAKPIWEKFDKYRFEHSLFYHLVYCRIKWLA
ncbi:Lactase-phlorizin hydrolase [Bienertia sinuspersici]